VCEEVDWGVFTDLHYIASNERVLKGMMNCKGCEKRWPWPTFKVLKNLLEGTK
jgi:hypothetical protein